MGKGPGGDHHARGPQFAAIAQPHALDLTRVIQHQVFDLRRDPNVAADVLCKNLLEAARDFASEPMDDDVAILAIRRN